MRVAALKMPGSGPDIRESERSYAAQIPHRMSKGEGFEPKPWDDVEVMTEELLAWLRGEGRHAAPELVQQVGQIWMAYAQMFAATATPADKALLPNQIGQQQQQQQPQASPTAGLGAGAMPGQGAGPEPTQSQAQGAIANADQQAESMARITDAQES